MMPQVSYFIPGALEDTDKHIEVVNRHQVTTGKKVQEQIKMRNDNGDTYIAILHNVLLSPDLCDRLFSNTNVMNLEHNCLFQKGFCTV